jgi:hypothetical protein
MFCSVISESTERITFSIWASLWHRIVFSMSPNDSNDRVATPWWSGKSFVPSSSNRFEGIIAHLSKPFCENVYNYKIVTISMAAGWQSCWAKYTADLMNNTQFLTVNALNQCIYHDFKMILIESPDKSICSHLALLGHINQRTRWLMDQRMRGHRWNLTVATSTTSWMG